jgi:hypothetical protein
MFNSVIQFTTDVLCMRQVVTLNMPCLACDAVRSAVAIFVVTVMSAPE